jgi:ATP-dependent helicase/nuclease subunit A
MTIDPVIAAADPNSSAWVAANAGSGKTYTLANRVTRLLLAEVKPERILCLTYTKAAAAEMQARLFAQLGDLSMMPDADLAAKLKEICGEALPSTDWPKARRLFAQALETPGGLKIQTIHGFCQSVLTRFPLEAHIAPGFRVLDEQSATALIAEAQERVLERAGTGDVDVAAALARLVTEVSEFQLNEILHNCLGTDRRKVERFLALAGSGEGSLERKIQDLHGLDGKESEEDVAVTFCALARAALARLRDVCAWLDSGATTDVQKSTRLRAALSEAPALLAFAALRSALLTAKGEKPKRLATNGRADANPALFEFLDEFTDAICVAEERRRVARAAELAHATLIVADAVRKEYAAAKRACGVLDYDDLIVETQALLEKSEAAQWVLFKLDGGIDHILVDEAQDTSPEQWAIVSRLTEEFFAGVGVRRDSTVRTIFAVGDEKQSIFSFQGAEPEQFEHYRAHFEAKATGANRFFANVPLVTSRRSAPEILKFVDAVFHDPAAREGLTSTDDPIEHSAYRDKARGCVELWPAIAPLDEPEPDPQREVDLPSEASPAARLAEKIADQIKEWRDNRVRLPARERPIRPGDIMILLPRREPFGSLIIRALKDRNIPVAGADRMRLTQEIAVRDLIALGKFVLQPEDDLTLAALLRSPFCAIGEEALLALCHGRTATLWAELSRRKSETKDFASAHAFLLDMLGRADFVPPFEFYGHALTTHGMRKRLLARLGTEADDAIEEFLSLAFAYESTNSPSLEGFIAWIEEGGAEVKRDMERGRDEVRVMTVHGAKGLEADIVFLPDTTGIPQSPTQKGHLLFGTDTIFFPVTDAQSPANIAAAKQEAHDTVLREHRRLLYVALTRARDRLYICGFENKKGIRDGSWYRLAEAAAERIGAPVARGDETIRVIGEIGEQFGLDIEPAKTPIAIPAWASAAPPEPASPRLLRPSNAVDGDEPPANSPRGANGARRFKRGLLVHTLLSHLPEIAPAERADAAERFLRARDVAEEEIAALVAETLAVVSDPVFAAVFSSGSRAEVAITAELPELGPGARVNGRIDRIAVSDDEVLIVDLKTNRPPPEEAEVAQIYIAQMALYRAAAVKIFPGRRIACALVWTDGPKLMQLSERILAAQFAAIQARLDPEGSHS